MNEKTNAEVAETQSWYERLESGLNLEHSKYADRETGIPARWNGLTERIIGLAIEVHRELGPGLLERVYEDAMEYEFTKAGIAFQRQFQMRVPYKGVLLSEMRIDLVVEQAVVVELKSVAKVPDVDLAQLVSYLRIAGLPVGLLINFNVPLLKDGVFRRVNSRTNSSVLNTSSPLSVPSATSAFNS